MINWSKYNRSNINSNINDIRNKGRYGDTMLMHVSPEEVGIMSQMGGISKNPSTGLPEGFMLLPFLQNLIMGGLGGIGSAVSGLGSAIASGLGGAGTAAAAPVAAKAGIGGAMMAPVIPAAPTIAGLGTATVPELLASSQASIIPGMAATGGGGGMLASGVPTTWEAMAAAPSMQMPSVPGTGNKLLGGIGKAGSKIANFAKEHPGMSLMGLYGIGSLASSLSEDDPYVYPDTGGREGRAAYNERKKWNIEQQYPSGDNAYTNYPHYQWNYFRRTS